MTVPGARAPLPEKAGPPNVAAHAGLGLDVARGVPRTCTAHMILTGMDTPSTVAGEDKQQHEEALAVCLLFPTLADVRLVVV